MLSPLITPRNPVSRNWLTVILLALSSLTLIAQNYPRRAATLTDLLALPLPPVYQRTFIVDGRTAVDDGGGGTFYYDPDSVALTNRGTIFTHPRGGRVFRLYSGPLNVKWFGAVGDGVTDDAVAFSAAQALVTANTGGTIVVPYTTVGYKIGDGDNTVAGSDGTSITVSSNTEWLGEGGVTLIHGARKTSGNPYLFEIDDASNVRISGFTVDGLATSSSDQARVAVSMNGVIENILIENLRLINCTRHAIQYADAETDPLLARFTDLTIRNINLGGQVGVADGDSGINIFPRSMSGDEPAATNLLIDSCTIDISSGSDAVADHGPVGLKVNNTRGIKIVNCEFIGGGKTGAQSCLSIANGCRNVQINNCRARKADIGLSLSTAGNISNARTQDVVVNGWIYELDSATGSNAKGLQIQGAVRNLTLDNIILRDSSLEIQDLYSSDINVADGDGTAAKNWQFGKISIYNGVLIMNDASNVLQEDVEGLHIEDLYVFGGAGTGNGRVRFDADDWAVQGLIIDRLTIEQCDNDGMLLSQLTSGAIFHDITVLDGNPDDDADAYVISDGGLTNTFGRISVIGATNNMDRFYHKIQGEGAIIKELYGTVTSSLGMHLGNMHDKAPIQGGMKVHSSVLDLSGASTDQVVFFADANDWYISSIAFMYTEASSADAGVQIRVGNKTSSTDILAFTSEVSKAVGDKKYYNNTTGTEAFSPRLVSGDFISMGTAGGKVGTGNVIVTVNLIPSY